MPSTVFQVVVHRTNGFFQGRTEDVNGLFIGNAVGGDLDDRFSLDVPVNLFSVNQVIIEQVGYCVTDALFDVAVFVDGDGQTTNRHLLDLGQHHGSGEFVFNREVV